MSKQSEAKIAQNYRTTSDTCSNCVHYRSELVQRSYGFTAWADEKNKRCGLGGFAVHKTAVCDRHEGVA